MLLYITSGIALVALGYVGLWWTRDIEVGNTASLDPTPTPVAAGCGAPLHRPIAVMLAGDPETRPLSGIGSADIVVEMPVTPNGITRFMAVYECTTPSELGSVRSAREDFIPLVLGFDAIYAHWGGEAGALERLNAGVADNIDALKYEGTVFYRKRGIEKPHNGFTSMGRLVDKAKDLTYDLAARAPLYTRAETGKLKKNLTTLTETISVPYPYPYTVTWAYDASTGLYRRTRAGTPEMDALTDTQVAARTVVVMKTVGRPLRDQYLRVDTTGRGTAMIYQSGAAFPASWSKDPANSKSRLIFYDAQGTEVRFAPGPLWIEITL